MQRFKLSNMHKKKESIRILVPVNRLHCAHFFLVYGKEEIVDLPDEQDIYAPPGDVRRIEKSGALKVELLGDKKGKSINLSSVKSPAAIDIPAQPAGKFRNEVSLETKVVDGNSEEAVFKNKKESKKDSKK